MSKFILKIFNVKEVQYFYYIVTFFYVFGEKTIIFLRHYTKTGFEISGYIDYAEKLVTDDWTDFFKGNKRLWPQTNDLGYYHWRVGKSTCNDTSNYKVSVIVNQQ